MNKVLIGVNAVLVLAVGFLFYKVSNLGGSPAEEKGKDENAKVADKAPDSAKKVTSLNTIATTPTGKIAFVNIDILNEECQEVKDMTAEAKRSKENIEAAVESLSRDYQKKMEEYEQSARAQIRPKAEMEALEKSIMDIQMQGKKKQEQMDNLTIKYNERNIDFQSNLKDFLLKWNNGRYDYILTYSEAIPTMLLGNASLDVTKEVVEKVNEEYNAKKATVKK
ncbi:MAG: hypothetical protein K0S32_755 [Bacteroidetes bacterium]|jgi:outer membrane protein|nr:hypothetical protein [Bacteroidota bacterium]